MAGWGAAALLALAAVILSVVQPAVLITIPLGVALLALPPRRPVPMALGALLLLAVVPTRDGGTLASVERGWALMAVGWFVAVTVVRPGWGVLTRGLISVMATFASSAAVLSVAGGVARADRAVIARLRSSADAAVVAFGERLGTAPNLGDALDRAVQFQSALYPALLGLATLAALALAWWGQRRLALQDVQPLGRFREFRFPDALVWLLIAGIVLLAAPIGALASRAGSNLLAFMGALYALRGLAVIWVLGSPGPLGLVLGGIAAVLLYPLALATAVVVGLSDTWLDIRARARATGPNP